MTDWIRLWVLRMLTPWRALGRFVKDNQFADDDVALLVLAVREAEPAFNDALRLLRSQTVREYQVNIARMLAIPPRAVQASLSKDGKLLQACVLQWRHGRAGYGWCPEFVNSSFAEKLMDDQFKLSSVIRTIAPLAPKPSLAVGDFEHAQQHMDYLLPYLREVIHSGRSGVNIYIHGEPGTGESERGLARAFERAEEAGALLLLDEVDTFLQDRRHAQRSWEVSLVNEMLTQMERFRGIFIASTNLMDGLDEASLRRFDLKLCFGYLSPDQATRLLIAHCRHLRIDKPLQMDLDRLQRIENTAPGDFANVARQHQFKRFRSAADFISAIEQECAHKTARGGRRVGFQ